MEELLKFCRVCLVPEEEIEFNSLFDKKGNYAEKIRLLTGLISDTNDDIKQIICSNCVNELDAACRLRLQILDANDYISVLVEEAKCKLNQDSKSLEQDIEDTIPAEKILRKDFKAETHKGPNISGKAGKSSKKSSKAVKRASVINIEPIVCPLNQIPIPKEEPKKASPEHKVELISSTKRNRKISSKLLESSEPAAKKIKKMHMMNTPELNKSKDSPPVKGTKMKMPSKEFRETPPLKEDKTKIPLMKAVHESPSTKKSKLKVSSKKSRPIKEAKLKSSLPREDVKVQPLPHKCRIKNSEEHSVLPTEKSTYDCFFCDSKFEEYSNRIMHMQKNHTEQLKNLYTKKSSVKKKKNKMD